MTKLQENILRHFHRLSASERIALSDLEQKTWAQATSEDEVVKKRGMDNEELIESIIERLNHKDNVIDEVQDLIRDEVREALEK